MTENEAVEIIKQVPLYRYECELEKGRQSDLFQALYIAIQALEEIQQYRAIGTVEELQSKLESYREFGTMEELKTLKEKNNKDFELLLKEVKESYPMFKGAYVELDVFMGDVMRRFTRDRKQT